MLALKLALLACVLLGCVHGAINVFYPADLTEPTCSGSRSWTMWFNLNKPSSAIAGDNESIIPILTQYPRAMCSAPIGIQAQSTNYVGGNWNYGWQWQSASNLAQFVTFSSTAPGGVDFRVRYCCPTGAFDGTTTTTTTTMPLDNTSCGKQSIQPRLPSNARIYGGTEAIPNSWPWMLSYMQIKPCGTSVPSSTICYGACGATLISKDYAITAAHCISSTNPATITLTAGMHNRVLTTEGTRQNRTVLNIYVHPKYDTTTNANDIALLRVSTSFILNTYVQPACLPGGEPQPGDQVAIVGWGAETLGGSMVNNLKQAYTSVVGYCDSAWPLVDSTQQLCVADSVSGASMCQGDSGGPILAKYLGQYVVSGVSSFVKDCITSGATSKPDVYTRVAFYKSWIKSYTG